MDEEGVIVIEDVVAAPELHKNEVVPLAVKVTEPPIQIISSLLALPDVSVEIMVSTGAVLVTVIVMLAVTEQPVVPVTV